MRVNSRGLFSGAKYSMGVVQKGALSAVMALGLASLPALPAVAHQSPSGCNGNRLNTSILKDRTEVAAGDTITYTVTAANTNLGSDIACDITNATIEITLPAADGTPTGAVVVLASGVNFPAGTGVTVIGTAQYVVAVNPGIIDIVAQVSANGTLHDAPSDHSALIVKTIGTSVVVPTTPPSSGGSSGGGGSSSAGATTPKLPNTGTR